MNRTARKLLVPGVGIVLATSGFAFMASNTFANNSAAGSGDSAVSGYTVSNLHYSTSDCTTPNVCYLNGDIKVDDPSAPDAGAVAVKYDGTGWFDCTVGDYDGPRLRSFRCDFRGVGGLNPGGLNTLTVAASG